MRRLLLAVLFALPPGCASQGAHRTSSAPPDSVLVCGAVEQPTAWSSALVEERFRDAIKIVDHETKHGGIRLRALPLALLLRDAAIRYDEARKNPGLAMAVVVTASDGYTVVFTHDEVVPHGDDAHWVHIAFAEEDGPLPEPFAPARLVISQSRSGDARRMYGIERIEVVDLGNRPAR